MKNYDYAIIGNCTTAALIGSDCSIDWLCLPYFDSPSVFARLLDEGLGGYFRIKGVDTISITQAYIPRTPILKTVFVTKDGTFEVRDYMPRFINAREECYCPPEIHRDILLVSGNPKIIFELKPMPNYACAQADLCNEGDYIKIISQKGAYNSFYLYSNLDLDKIIRSEPMELRATSYALFSYHEKLEDINTDKVYIEYEKTKTYWLDWAYRTNVPGQFRDMVIRSAITLKLMTYQKTGAVIAAPTTSLPEIIGKDRNWDYRYCWIRDSAMVVDLYIRIGHLKTASNYMDFILNRMLSKRANISIMYGINGEKVLEEKLLEHLSGYENSKPVRIGNNAYRQTQNDIYGQLIEAIYTYFVLNKRVKIDFNEEIWTAVRTSAFIASQQWMMPDQGMWERRQEPRHYVHSKLMSWVAMNRAAAIAKRIGKNQYVRKWLEIASEIKDDVLKNGWNDRIGSFTMYYGSDELDAANLLMLHYGFIDKADARMKNTVAKSMEMLVKDNFVFRYLGDDGLGVPKNSFIVCIFWMINALYLIGCKDKAKLMFDNIIRHANRFGLFSEDIEPGTGRLTGNFPQGYSHMAFIQTALLLQTDYNWSDVPNPAK
ncbi:MAG: glycoside hydrolase family 15 protein [Candidatus Omnitrophica bacterium]|nr:glycoside hydrolase family 15 protein [Candidatus Omnitrophota bacterium]